MASYKTAVCCVPLPPGHKYIQLRFIPYRAGGKAVAHSTLYELWQEQRHKAQAA